MNRTTAQHSMGNVHSTRFPPAIWAEVCLTLLIALCFWPRIAYAETIAFFPLLDLSADPNGINSPLTEKVRQELLSRGKILVPEDEVMHFLIRNRIRTLSTLTSYQTSLVSKELKADLVLQGTVCQVKEGETALLSLNLQLSRASNEQIIWARTEHISYSDLISLLGLEDSHKLEDLYAPFFATLFASLPDDIELVEEVNQNLNIDTVIIHPKYLRSGEEVSCRIKMHNPLDEEIAQPQIVLRSGGDEYPLTLDEEGYYLQASWPAREGAGSYPVTLHARWPSGFTKEGVIGSYSVDVQEPVVKLFLIGTERDGDILFSDKLVIIPKLMEPEPISRWEITVLDVEDEAIVIMGASGHIPRRITWQGKTSLGNMAPAGEYLITFKVWDRAQREASSEATVQFLPEPPEIQLELTKEEDQVIVDLDNLIDTPLNYWWAKFYKEEGGLLKLVQGTELPVKIELDIKHDSEQKIQCLLMARDILGNQSKKNIANLFQQVEDEAEDAETSIETEWVEEF